MVTTQSVYPVRLAPTPQQLQLPAVQPVRRAPQAPFRLLALSTAPLAQLAFFPLLQAPPTAPPAQQEHLHLQLMLPVAQHVFPASQATSPLRATAPAAASAQLDSSPQRQDQSTAPPAQLAPSPLLQVPPTAQPVRQALSLPKTAPNAPSAQLASTPPLQAPHTAPPAQQGPSLPQQALPPAQLVNPAPLLPKTAALAASALLAPTPTSPLQPVCHRPCQVLQSARQTHTPASTMPATP